MTTSSRIHQASTAIAGAVLLTCCPLSVAHAQTTPVPGIPGPAAEQQGPALAPGPGNHVYVGDLNGLIRELDATGAHVRDIASLPNGVAALAVDPDGNLYASSHWFDYTIHLWQSAVTRVNPSGDVAWTASTVVGGTLAVSDDTVWVGGVQSDTGSTLSVYGLATADGTSVGTFANSAGQPVRDLAALPNGHLIVSTDTDATEYTTAGIVVRSLGDFGSQVAVGPDGDLYGAAGRAPGGGAGAHSFQLHRTTAGGELIGTYASARGFTTDIIVTNNGVVWASGFDNVPLSRIDPSTPDAALTAPSTPMYTGTAVTLDASDSTAVFTDITGYSWDLDGDGHFERSTGTTPSVSTSFRGAGDHDVSVRVTVLGGGSSVATKVVDARTPPPPGALGVSINRGAQFTNNANVTIGARWPRYATHMLISNDGGFGRYSRLEVANGVPWRLTASAPERLPKTIYVRFEGGDAGPETYQDDVILDRTRPAIRAATDNRKGQRVAGSAAFQRRPATRRITLKIRASDGTSGVTAMQVTTNKRKPGAWQKYRATSKQRVARSVAFVRVRDRAGNVSTWHRVR